jgi:phosphatidylserine/phosphatidylglycerophosphate/cardiolipin synthase-like enzyme
MFVFDEPQLLDAIIAAKNRGIDARVMLNPARRSGETENEESRRKLVEAGVSVLDSNPAFDLTHEKSLVIDDAAAYVMSLNWETRNVTETRDYAVVTRHPKEVAEVAECFDADWHRATFTPHEGSALIWCNTNGRERFAHFIDRAQHSLWLQNERYQDAVHHRARGARRPARRQGPRHRAAAAYAEGREAHRRRRRIAHHGRCRCQGAQAQGLAPARQDDAGGRRAARSSGSVNLAPGSFDARRELAIEVDDSHVVGPLEKVAKQRLEPFVSAGPHRRRPDGRPREARQGERRRRPRARRRSVEGQAPKHKKH